jgi:head-tail adaptor
MDAGKYNQAFTWQLRTISKNTTNGQEEENFSDNGTLWGEMVLTNGQEQDEYGALQAVSEGTVRLRQFPNISALDRLLHKHFQDVYVIRGVHRDQKNNETICDIKHFESLNIDGTAATEGYILMEDSDEVGMG